MRRPSRKLSIKKEENGHKQEFFEQVTPQSVRIRKKLLTGMDRKRANRITTSTSTH
ncbi:hypothetical protein [Basfia succiniciproducens]|uniref:hypothetical protein n=1 Tax=Basfia succiniciproducens TaxID=653940 RepID=UPI000ACF3F68|nr:hypothetical protein [Basfia succiniciproducens]